MKRAVILGILYLSYAGIQPAFAESPGSVAVVDSSKRPGSFLATKDESKDYRVSERRIRIQRERASKEVVRERARNEIVLQPRLPHKIRLPWAPYAPGD